MINDATLGAKVVQGLVNFSSSGDNIVIPGTAGQIIRVLQFFFVLSAASTLTYKSLATALSGPLEFPAAGAQVQDFIQLPMTCVEAGDDFVINSTNAVQVGGTIWYMKQ